MRIKTLNRYGFFNFFIPSAYWEDGVGISLGFIKRNGEKVEQWIKIFWNEPPDFINDKMVWKAHPLCHENGVSLVKPRKGNNREGNVLVFVDTEDYITEKSVEWKFYFLEGHSDVICKGYLRKTFLKRNFRRDVSCVKALLIMNPESKIRARMQSGKTFELVYTRRKEVFVA